MNDIPVLVSLQSCARRDDGSEEPISLLTAGTLSLDDDAAVLTYQENLDESIPPQTVVITAREDMITMHREGDYARGSIKPLTAQWIWPFSAPDSIMIFPKTAAPFR